MYRLDSDHNPFHSVDRSTNKTQQAEACPISVTGVSMPTLPAGRTGFPQVVLRGQVHTVAHRLFPRLLPIHSFMDFGYGICEVSVECGGGDYTGGAFGVTALTRGGGGADRGGVWTEVEGGGGRGSCSE